MSRSLRKRKQIDNDGDEKDGDDEIRMNLQRQQQQGEEENGQEEIKERVVDETKKETATATKEQEDEDNNTNNNTTTSTATTEEDLEDFEINASPFVSQTEATQQYLLPAGTLEVCKVVQERLNPRNPRWAKVKLYARSEIRQRSHKRHGGIEGLRAERDKRAQLRYEKDARGLNNLFG